MTPAKLVFKNILRRRGRFIFTLFGIVIGMASFVTFMALGATSNPRSSGSPPPWGPTWW